MTKFEITPLRVFSVEDLMRQTHVAPIDELKRPPNPEWAIVHISPEDAPKEILWSGSQWRLTDYGLETHRNAPYHYFLKWDDVLEDPHIVDHLAGKGWCDIVDMLEAICVGRLLKRKVTRTPTPRGGRAAKRATP